MTPARQEGLGLSDRVRVEVFGEPAVDWREKITGRILLTAIAPKPLIAARSAHDFA